MVSNIRNFVLASAVMAVAALAANTAMAEATVKVPFNFNVAGKQCPAGVYLVNKDSADNVVTLTSKDSSRSFKWVLSPGKPAPTDTRVILKFDETSDTHSLQSLQYGSLTAAGIDAKIKHPAPVPSFNSRGR